MFLGNAGLTLACAKWGLKDCPGKQISRQDKKMSYSYGKALALGDFYNSEENLFNDTKAVYQMSEIFKCMDKEGAVLAEQKTHPEVEYPDCTWINIALGGDYLELTSTNYNHFSWDNIKEYVKVHATAISYALIAKDLKDMGDENQSQYYLNRALMANALADHFLTDAFAAGHVRTPRWDLKEWAESRLSGPLKKQRGDILASLMHNFESKNLQSQEVGLAVRNSIGDKWRTQSDGSLHECTKNSDPGIIVPLEAVSASVGDIFNAYYNGIEPKDVYEAIKYVPYTVEGNIEDKYKLPTDSTAKNAFINTLKSFIAEPLNELTINYDIEKLSKEMTSLMASFRARITNEINSDKALSLRLPAKFKEAMKNVH